MNASRSVFKQHLCATLALELDPLMKHHGWDRSSDSIQYVRNCEAGVQQLLIEFQLKPVFDPGAMGMLVPLIWLQFPEVNRVAMKMVGGDEHLIGCKDLTLAQPLSFVAPKEAHAYWFVYDLGDFAICVQSIRHHVEEWGVPFLNQYSTVASLARYFRDGDDRIPAQRHFHVYVAASYVILGQPQCAMEVLERKLGKAGPRRDYASAFEYVRRLTRE